MYPVQYHGQTQEKDSDVTSEASYNSDTEPSYSVGKIQPVIKPLGMDEYFSTFQNNDFDDAILAWENSPVNIVEVEVESKVEPPYQTDLEELMENLSHSYLPNFKLSKSECINMNLGTDQEPKSIQMYKGMGESKFEQWI